MNHKDPNRHTQISKDVLQRVYAHARRSHPEECVGLLIGPRDTCPVIDHARICENAQNLLHQRDPLTYPRDARTAYNLGPRDLMFLYESFGSARPVKIVYHSHANVGAYFSEEDRRMAMVWFENGEPVYDLSYLVIDAQAERIAGAKLFRWNALAQDFELIAEYDGE